MGSKMAWAGSVSVSDAETALQESVRAEVYQRMAPEDLLAQVAVDRPGAERAIVELIDQILGERGLVLGWRSREELQRAVLNEIVGYGPIQWLIEDPSVQEILVNGPRQIWVERGGVLELTDVRFADEQHVLHVLHRIVDTVGRRIDLSNPLVNARLPNGSRVNAVIAPVALNGPAIAIRKFRQQRFTLADLVRAGGMSAEAAQYITAGVRAPLNILVSGGTGSGKTTLLNALSAYIPERERIITIEDTAELQLHQPHVVRLEARPSNVEGTGAITIRDLVVNALRMRPNRIIVGEVRHGETLDMLQAMNTGHPGSMTTAHANSARHAISRLETMFLMSGVDFPLSAIRRQIADAIQVIVHQNRLPDGSRRVVSITEVTGMRGDEVGLQDLFVLADAPEGGGVNGQALRHTGAQSHYLTQLRSTDVELPDCLTRAA